MTKSESAISIEILRTLLRLDADTGALYWMPRSVSQFSTLRQSAAQNCAIWNGRFANTLAFTTKQGMGYLHGSIGDVKFLAHRVVFALFHGHWPHFTVDHINGKKTDNAPANLRDVPHQTNMKNQTRRVSSTSGFMGVHFDRKRLTYEAYITINGRKKSLGRFARLDDAVTARFNANAQYGFHENHGRITA